MKSCSTCREVGTLGLYGARNILSSAGCSWRQSCHRGIAKQEDVVVSALMTITDLLIVRYLPWGRPVVEGMKQVRFLPSAWEMYVQEEKK